MAEGLVAGTRIFRITISGTMHQQSIQTGWHMRDTGLGTESAESAALAASTWVTSAFLPTQSNDFALQRVEALRIDNKEYFSVQHPNTAGAISGDSASSMLCALMSLRSNQRARHRNGRMFWPLSMPPVASMLNIEDRTRMGQAIESWATEFLGNPVTETFRAVVVAQPRPLTANRPAIEHSWIDVETIRMSQIATVQRRRKVGVGS